MPLTAARDVVVLGSAGGVGRHVVVGALQAGHRVTATARHPEKVEALDVVKALGAEDRDRLRVVRADVREAAEVSAAVPEGAVVVAAFGITGRRAHGLFSDGARAIVQGMREQNASRFIGITSAGVREDDVELAAWYRFLVRPLIRDLYDDMGEMERIIVSADLDWTFVRPVLLLDRPPSHAYRVADGVTPRRGRLIGRQSVARFIVEEIQHHRWSRRAPTLAE